MYKYTNTKNTVHKHFIVCFCMCVRACVVFVCNSHDVYREHRGQWWIIFSQ